MQEYRISAVDDKVVLYFGTESSKINAYSLAASLISFADAVKKANRKINPGYDVEVIVETLSDGSFKVVLQAVYKAAKNLFSVETLCAIAVSVVSTAIYEKALSDRPTIIINTDEVIIDDGTSKLIVPRNVYECTERIKKDIELDDSIQRLIDTVKKDDSIKTFGITQDTTIRKPEIEIQKYRLEEISTYESTNENADINTIEEEAKLEISKAILERGVRKWEFVWRGVKVSAPILDNEFYDNFFSHEIKIAPGDVLDVNLRIIQRRIPDVSIYENIKYEVVKVYKHTPRLIQESFKKSITSAS